MNLIIILVGFAILYIVVFVIPDTFIAIFKLFTRNETAQIIGDIDSHNQSVFQPSITEVHEYTSKSFYGNSYAQFGEVVDMWGDLIEGYGMQAEDFFKSFHTIMVERKMLIDKTRWHELSAGGFNAPTRSMQFYYREPVTIAVYVARQGVDLYVSWRVFVRGGISIVKVIALMTLGLITAIPFSRENVSQLFGEEIMVNLGMLISTIFIVWFVLFSFVSVYGIFFRQGDNLSLLREPFHELHHDDVISLSQAVHRSIIAAADGVGIDITKLQPREFSMQSHRQKRRI